MNRRKELAMAAMEEHSITLTPQDRAAQEAVAPGQVAYIRPASPEAVAVVLAADEASDDGRSPWMWVILPSGDVVLGTFPQGVTYELIEEDVAGGQQQEAVTSAPSATEKEA